MTTGKAELTFDGSTYKFYDVREKRTTSAKNGKGSLTAKLALPKSWAGKRVLCLLLEEPDENETHTDEK